MLSPESSIAFYVFNYPIRYYSLIMFLAISVGSVLSYVVAKMHKKADSDVLLDMLPFVILCGVLGARVYYVLLDWAYYSTHVADIFALYKGGLSIHGAIIGGFLGGFYYIKRHNLNLWIYADIFAYGLLLGQAIGRFGNYFNIEAFGKPCYFSSIICLQIPEEYRPIEYQNIEFFHPTFLYEAILNIIILLFLFFIVRKLAKNKSGIVFFSYLGLYSISRFFIESLRLDSVLNIGAFHVAQIVSVFIIILSFVMICRLNKAEASQ